MELRLYRVTVVLEVEAKDEDDAYNVAELECSAAFVTCVSAYELNPEK